MSHATKQAADDEQQREHTDLRTLDAHFSAAQVYRACHAAYAGTDVLQAKEHQRADASSDRAADGGTPRGTDAAAAGDLAGESEVSL